MNLLKTTIAASLLVVGASSAQAAEFTMKIATSNGPIDNNYFHTPLLAFEKEVEEKSGGRIDVEIHWNYALGGYEAVTNLVRKGLVEALTSDSGIVTPHYPNVQVLNIPYLFINRKVAYEVLDGPFGKKLADDMAAESNIRPLMWMENGGYRHFSSNKPLTKLEDLKGQKIRTMVSPIFTEIVEALGASATPIEWADLYTALQTGVVDGEENSLPTFRLPKFEEVQKYIMLDGHVYGASSLFASEIWLKSLPDDMRQIIQVASDNMRDSNRILSQSNTKRDRKYLEDYGVIITDVSNEEKRKFQELTQGPAIEFLKTEVNPDLITDIQAAVKEAEAKLIK